ncbi:MAG: hypothetical protein APF81_18370 [Desulfosporosinus sp. BRH_c37]|nr:MAG: hypothetical protein APF81_18370 [Desulfosporosinus sp. BRH_c37]
MVTGKITLVIVEEDKKGLQQILRQLAGILQYLILHREATILYDSQKISYDRILETVLQASYHISRFYAIEEES